MSAGADTKTDPVPQTEKKSYIGGTPGGKQYKKFEIPTAEQIAQEDFMNNCIVRGALSTVMGGGMGVVFGLFMGGLRESMDPNAGMVAAEAAVKKVPLQQVLKTTLKEMGSASMSYARTFAVMGALYAGSECAVETIRAKRGMENTAIAGCFTGGALAYGGGVQAMCLGCATFGAFSVMIDRFMERD
eukprot:CAMPEP_0117652958 /NCGR_PEP_ID=MMETSP0804-20121206/2926_1 /TAXON_ID=1074897 /ORGANISM="Tetraselmis astigmatica, Strain CCMP880" /LENGTH=186 /DNA_ID=CAMNT_0005459083 /DNA_START=73 /DNA_END=633 /DNA_ORIENTATION=+